MGSAKFSLITFVLTLNSTRKNSEYHAEMKSHTTKSEFRDDFTHLRQVSRVLFC